MATEQAKRDYEVASIIRDQLGKGFFMMVGANQLTYGNEDGLSYLEFRFRMFSKANACRIILDSDDTYRLRFFSARGVSVKVYTEVDTVYADQLKPWFRKVTGLETEVPRFTR